MYGSTIGNATIAIGTNASARTASIANIAHAVGDGSLAIAGGTGNNATKVGRESTTQAVGVFNIATVIGKRSTAQAIGGALANNQPTGNNSNAIAGFHGGSFRSAAALGTNHNADDGTNNLP